MFGLTLIMLQTDSKKLIKECNRKINGKEITSIDVLKQVLNEILPNNLS